MSAMALASARDTAFATIDGLTGLGLAPTPTNYSVWHSHISGENPGLSRSIQELVARAIPITDEMLSDFWRRFCAPAMDPSVVTDAGERLGRVMASIAESISGAGAATSGFTDALARFGDEIVAAVRMPDMAGVMREATRRMLVETKRMVEGARGLDGDLRGASREVQALRNDLEAPALDVAPGIGDVLGRLRDAPETLLARLSGSGATCFALCADEESAGRLAAGLAEAQPGWWVRACRLGAPLDPTA